MPASGGYYIKADGAVLLPNQIFPGELVSLIFDGIGFQLVSLPGPIGAALAGSSTQVATRAPWAARGRKTSAADTWATILSFPVPL
jgi:hypothetical protein